ncbi:SHOCT domain-containing protein [Flagellimonas profundi]|uniref:SHOCT domain-containing protein n=1 Tax=Flagellimonas profundi TaxID=2915620 RepID=A0ABS3FEC7_9FLAO|nr:SHOCT domain-containing protein [Allomuricauda profundi]MBO0341466.1 SHOCT domain-containing protein [Allomuricauda profundi]
MHYYDGHFGGMHLIWWIIWIIFLAWIFFIPSDIPYQRHQEDSPLEILKKRFAKGEISKEEFEESKKVLQTDNESKTEKP